MNLVILFNTTLIIVLGIGIYLGQIIGESLLNGLWIIGFGFLYMIGYCIYDIITSKSVGGRKE